MLLPVGSRNVQRLIGLVPAEFTERRNLTFDDIRGYVEPLVDVTVTEVNWFSTYKVNHRVAEHFRMGRAFLLGDAGHVHSPTGGQGMNTGIGDAINLGWKIVHVIQQRAPASMLDTYEPERIAFARKLVSSTDEAFRVIIAPGLRGQLGRRILIPALFLIGSRFKFGRRAAFDLISQTRIEYEDSPISEGQAGPLKGGDRLPWIDDGTDNFAPLRSLDWQMHVYGKLAESLKTACRELRLALHAFAWSAGAKEAGLKQDAAYLVRPDGYVALAVERQDNAPEELEKFAQANALTFAG